MTRQPQIEGIEPNELSELISNEPEISAISRDESNEREPDDDEMEHVILDGNQLLTFYILNNLIHFRYF